MIVTMALLHLWVSIQELTPALEDLNSFKDNIKNGLYGRSATEEFTTESRKFIPVSISKSNLEVN